MKRLTSRVIEIDIHQSKKNPKIGHAVALLFPCNHHKYLGITLFKGERNPYKVQNCRVIKFEDFEVMDKEVCKLCPSDDIWLDDIPHVDYKAIVDVLESLDDI